MDAPTDTNLAGRRFHGAGSSVSWSRALYFHSKVITVWTLAQLPLARSGTGIEHLGRAKVLGKEGSGLPWG